MSVGKHRREGRVRNTDKRLSREEIIRIRTDLAREKERLVLDIKHPTRGNEATKKLLRNQVKLQLLQISTLLRNQLHGQKPTVYQVLGYFMRAGASPIEVHHAANVMVYEIKEKHAAWTGSPGFVLPSLQLRKIDRRTTTWLQEIERVLHENRDRPLTTSEIARKAGIGSNITAARRTNAAMQLLQSIGKASRLPEKIIDGKPTAVWQKEGQPIRVNYPNVFTEIMNQLYNQNKPWVRLTQLHSPKKTQRGEKGAATVGNPEASHTSSAIRAAAEVLEKAGIIQIKRGNAKFTQRGTTNMVVPQYEVGFTTLGKRLWAKAIQDGALSPRLAELFTSRKSE